MKKIYFITGLGCTGKSTLVEKLSSELNIPKFNADNAYALVMDKLNMTREEVAPLATEGYWDKHKDWGIYGTPEILLETCYNELFSYIPPDVLILEGQGLFSNRRENAVVNKIFEGYEKRYLVINIDYEQWLKFRAKRELLPDEVMPKFLEEKEFYEVQKNLTELVPEKNRWIIKDPTKVECSPTGGVSYQGDEFSNPKWDVFNFPQDMKGKTFMEISCNGGWFCKKASDCGAKVSGIDISWQVLDRAMDLNPDGTFYLSKIEDFNTTMRYDYVLCSSAIHYYHNREEQIKKISEMTDYFVLEAPMIDTDDFNIRYQGGEDGEFCSVISRGLILKWLNKYFKKVKKIGETIQPNSNNRPVYLCTK